MCREAGYTGEIKATGDVLVDLIYFMRRCGFDSFAPDVPFDPEVARAALDAVASPEAARFLDSRCNYR